LRETNGRRDGESTEFFIDPDTAQVVARIPVGKAYLMGIGSDAVWLVPALVADHLLRVDPRDNQVSTIGNVPHPSGGPFFRSAPVIGAGAMWIIRCFGEPNARCWVEKFEGPAANVLG
jgi:hypothetical protein